MRNSILRKILITIITVFSVSFSSAQSLLDNPDYRNSVKLKKQSELAFEDGDYEESKKLANESVLFAQKSDQWIIIMQNKYKANSILKRVNNKLLKANRLHAEVNFKEALIEGKSLYNKANNLYKDDNYLESIPFGLEALEVLKDIEYYPSESNLPAAYVVMNIPGDEDCLWNIAGDEFIYGEVNDWKTIYLANRDILPDPDNPNLIKPGMILNIPSLYGETRSGTLINGSIQ